MELNRRNQIMELGGRNQMELDKVDKSYRFHYISPGYMQGLIGWVVPA